MKIKDYVRKLTPEQREKHKDLTEDCLAREGRILELKTTRWDLINDMSNETSELYRRMRELYTRLLDDHTPNKTYKGPKETSISMIKPEEFYRA